MDLKAFYGAIEGDFEGVTSRIKKEESLARYLKRFIDDPSYGTMCDAFSKKDYREVFKQSHTLKGLCANLGLTELQKSVSDICESVRHGDPEEDITPLVDVAKTKYDMTIKNINMLDA